MIGRQVSKLAERFISDYNCPFAYIDDTHFNYCLNTFGYSDKWSALINVIKRKFAGNPDLFLDEYYRVREKIIQDILHNEDYIRFNTEMDMTMFALDKDVKNITSNNIYHRDNIGEYFISIDLKKANFQALHHVSSAIVKNRNTYEDFIGCYTDLDYIKESKYTRQVIFGKCNPKRQITVEKYYINEIRKIIGDIPSFELVSLSNDELVYKFTGDALWLEALEHDIADIKQKIYDTSLLEVSITFFKLNGYEFQNMETGKCKFTFYQKLIYFQNETKLVSVPMAYYKFVHKFINNLPLEDEDYLFSYEGSMCEFKDEFQIMQIDKDGKEIN